MSNDDLYEDEVIREVWARRAQLFDDYGGIDGYFKHLREDPCLTPDGKPWPTANPSGVAAYAKPLHRT
jgi:hypothetical protein